MKHVAILAWITLNTAAVSGNAGTSGRYLDLSFSERDAWVVHADEPWWAGVDIRDMLNLFHPLVESGTGTSAGATRTCTIPADWEPPFLLRFHCADNYYADPENHTAGMLGTESFFEHRFKQVLVDNRIVWDRDVIDENMPTSPAVFEVDITPYVTPGTPFQLGLRVLDKTSTRQRNNRDVWFIGGTWFAAGDGKTEQPPRFHTAVWFGDPIVGEAEAVRAAPVGVRPSEAAAGVRHARRWPIPPPSRPAQFPVPLKLVTPDSIPEPGYPIRCGIPVPPGTLTNDQPVVLLANDGRSLPTQSEVTAWWPDGTARWLLVHAIAPAHGAHGTSFQLALATPETPDDFAITSPMAVVQQGQRVAVDTGPLLVSLGDSSATLLDSVRLGDRDQPVLTDLRLRMTVSLASGPEPVVSIVERTRVIEQGPVAVCVESSGSLFTGAAHGDGVHLGRFTFRLHCTKGLSTLATSIRIYNDTKPDPFQRHVEDEPLTVTDLALIGRLPGRTTGDVVLGSVDGLVTRNSGSAVELLQHTADRFTVSCDNEPVTEGGRAQGWIAAEGPGGCLQASLWRFWQQPPKALSVAGDELTIGLFAATEAEPAYLPRYGEAKRHDIRLDVSPVMPNPATMIARGRLADEPPRLFDGPWFCDSGGLELLDPQWPYNSPELAVWIARSYQGVTSADVGNRHWGLRDFGDFPYSPPMWRNGYYARILGALYWGVASGDQRWLERGFEMARHIADVDTVHIRPGHADCDQWDGLTCALGEDHSSHGGNARWSAFMAADQLFCHYWLTGDRDSRADALAGAEFLLRVMPGVGSPGVREATRPMLCLMRAYEATGDTKYLDAARRYCDRQFLAERVMDWRRGSYIFPLYQNYRTISAGQDAMYADVVYRLYRLTGEVDLARIVVAIADSVHAESMLPQEQSLGDFLFYPRYGRNSWYFPQMAVLFCQAYDLTGDLRFLRAARAAHARYLLCTFDGQTRTYQTADNFGYVDPVHAGWARLLRDVETEPFDVTGMVSDPDPSRFLPQD